MYSIRLLMELRSYRARISYRKIGDESTLIQSEDDFVVVYCVKQPWVSSSLMIAPQAKLDDGKMWLILVRRNQIDRYRMLKIMLGFKSGDHLNVEGCEMIPVSYFKLETLSHKQSYITVDGEIMEPVEKNLLNRTVEVDVVPKYTNVFTK